MALRKRPSSAGKRKKTKSSNDDSTQNGTSNGVGRAAAAKEKKYLRFFDNPMKFLFASTSSTKQLSRGGKNSLSISKILYTGVLIGATIAVGFVWKLTNPTDPRIQSFLTKACRLATCSRFVVPTRRTLKALRPLRRGEKLFEIPRDMMIWDIDAMRDDFVRNELFEARHSPSGNFLSSGAFLAAYIALQSDPTQKQTGTSPTRRSYLQTFPTLEELSYHPILWDIEDINNFIGPYSSTFAVTRAYRDMVTSEYKAFAEASPSFAQNISEVQYKVARVNVLSRSFSPGPIGIEEAVDNGEGDDDGKQFKEEMNYYNDKLGIDFSKGCHAMVPILDLLNHHPNPNVVYYYDGKKRVFNINAKSNVDAGWELMDSYGKYTDAHLFAKFGFVNGDGSGYTQASIALFHRVLELHDEFSYMPRSGSSAVIQKIQRKDLSRYLMYDDGYENCIRGPELDPEASKLKLLKLRHLLMIANKPDRWIIKVPPRDLESEPSESSNIPITLVPPEMTSNLKMNISPLVATCRLIVLNNNDLGGRAVEVLESNVNNPNFELKRGNHTLEYRAHMCVARLTSSTLMQYPVTVKEQANLVSQMNRNEFQSLNWTLANVQLSEMQTLQAISAVAFTYVRRIEEEMGNFTSPELTTRDHPCPSEYAKYLIDQPLTSKSSSSSSSTTTADEASDVGSKTL